MDLSTWIHSLTDVGSLLSAVGPWTLEVIAVMVFVESGLLFPFLPGDSLLVAATIARGGLGISAWQVILVASLAAVAGDQVGYWMGRRFGSRMFHPGSRVLSTTRLEAAQAFFDRHGPAARPRCRNGSTTWPGSAGAGSSNPTTLRSSDAS